MIRAVICRVVFALVLTAVVSPPATVSDEGQEEAPETPTPGVRWEYTVHDDKDKLVEEGKFRAFEGKIYTGATKQVGTYQDIPPNLCKVEIFEGKLKGKLDLHLTKAALPTWKGELVREGGAKYHITIVFYKD